MNAVPTKSFDDVIQAVNGRYQIHRANPDKKIKASSGVIITREGPKGVELLLGQLNKPGKPLIHGTWASFSGSVEAKDFIDPSIDGIFAAAGREAEEESLGLITKERVLKAINDISTRCIKNPGWSNFSAPVFVVRMDDLDISEFQNRLLSRSGNHEITDMKWISLNQIIDAYKTQVKFYEENTDKYCAENNTTREAAKGVKEIQDLYDNPPVVSSGEKIAGYVARTIWQGFNENLF